MLSISKLILFSAKRYRAYATVYLRIILFLAERERERERDDDDDDDDDDDKVQHTQPTFR